MRFLYKKFGNYNRRICDIRWMRDQLSILSQFDSKVLNIINVLQRQIAYNTLVYKTATSSVKGIIFSYLPWTEGYAKRFALVNSYRDYDRLTSELVFYFKQLQVAKSITTKVNFSLLNK